MAPKKKRKVMSQFDILCKTPPKVLVRQFVERFERPSGEKIASCAAELTYLCWMITHNGTAIKRATFMSYNTIISNSLSFDIVNKSLQFKYKTQKATILEASLKKLIPAWEFTIIPYNGQKHQSDITDIVSSLQLQFESSEEADKGNSHSKKMLKALLSEGESIWEITEKILNSFEYTSRFTKTKTLYQFLFLATFINCGRFSDIKNVDPKSFKLVQNKYLGVIIQCLVTETKTSVSRHIYFFSARGRIDPLVYLDEFLRNSEPVLKRVNRTGNSSSNKQEYQLLKDNLVRSYNKALKKNAPYPIFAIKNGPKSHIGRHLMTSFLSMKGLTELTNVVGNWSDKRASAVARTTYTHQITAIPDHYFALVSRYYAYDPISKEMIALKDETNPIEEWQHIEQLKGSAEGSIRYPAWNGIISQEVLDYLSSYINRRI
nr:nls/FLPe fusion protein [Lentivirus shuttle vector pLV.FLPe.PurR]ADC44107.1 nls/FLPe fusion protein [Lentivirus shuttle vector pLV.FLPe]ANW61888.1 FLPo [Cloning vector DBH-FLPo]ANW61891.1 FLPo [Cloning vector DBH-p2a-FLPo]QNJ45080.1 FLPe [Cloning vector pGPS-LaPi-Flpe-Amp]QNJ45084.1 FLPe [Cloning vector pGPS-Flpe]QNJ45095.1 FlpE [Cloning vector pGPS-ArPi-Flpe-Amp]